MKVSDKRFFSIDSENQSVQVIRMRSAVRIMGIVRFENARLDCVQINASGLNYVDFF